MDAYFQGHWRLDWGMGNPNKTALLLVFCFLASWTFAVFQKRLFAVSLLCSAVFGAGLLHTYSRGGMLALLAGIGCLGYGYWKQLSRMQWLAALLLILALASYAVEISASARMMQPFLERDYSVLNRWEIIKCIPELIRDAPTGWGLGNSGAAYMSWCQPIGRLEVYRTLVSSHLTWLVELGWPERLGYILFWCVVFAVCSPASAPNWFCVLLSIWAAFFTGSAFSSAAESPVLWIIPLAALGVAIHWRIQYRAGVNSKRLLIVYAGIVLFLATMVWFPLSREPLLIKATPNLVVVKNRDADENDILVIQPDLKIIGQHYGQNVRSLLHRRLEVGHKPMCFGFARNGSAAHAFPCATWILMGDQSDFIKIASAWSVDPPRHLIFINPYHLNLDLLRRLPSVRRIDMFIGNSFSGLTSQMSESNSRFNFLGIKIYKLKGAGDYIPDWTDVIFSCLDDTAAPTTNDVTIQP